MRGKQRPKHFRTEKKNPVLLRALSLLLCCGILTGALPGFVAALAGAELSVSVFYEGAAVEELVFGSSERVTLEAVSGGAADFQWQVLADGKSDFWVNIYDGTAAALTLSRATLAGVLDDAGSAYVRARASAAGREGVSAPVCLTVAAEEVGGGAPAPTSLALAGTEGERAPVPEGIVELKIEYLDAVTGLPIYTDYSAQLEAGKAQTLSVTSPTYLGYHPYYSPENPAESDPEKCTTPADAVTVAIPADFSASRYTVRVFYKAAEVSYAVRYYFQNIHDDGYTEDISKYRVSTALTGTIITDAELSVDAAGFTKLYHYPQSVAGDGSTVFECYYDRNYSMLTFDLAGGYGVDPVYARYGTPISVGEPVRPGYVFDGWRLAGEETAAEIPASIPAESRAYRAAWTAADTSYTIAYWLENADVDGQYDYIGVETRVAQSGDVIPAAAYLAADRYICGYSGAKSSFAHQHTDDCKPQGFKHYLYNKEKTEAENSSVTVKGDGSTTLNIYYTRQYYTLRFIYAKEYSPAHDIGHPNWYLDAAGFSIVGKSTYGFGNKKTQGIWPGGSGADYTLTELMEALKKYDGDSDKWGKVTEQPRLKEGLPYTTGVYPAAGTGANNGDYDKNGDRYYYFDLTARYGADLSLLWPVDVFDPILVPAHTTNGASGARGDGEWGNYAYLAGWNGEYKVNYSLQKENSTVKGMYQKLDDGLLFGSLEVGTEGTKEFSYADDTKTVREIHTTATASGKAVSSYLNYYLGYFNNGADIKWNIPRQWIYEYYVPVLDGALTAEQKATITAAGARAETVNLDGNTYYYYKTNDVIYQLFKRVVTSDDNRTADHQTQCSLVGYEFAGKSGELTDASSRGEKISNGVLMDKRESYTLRMFYVRKSYAFEKYNHSGAAEQYTLPFGTLLDSYVLDEQGRPRVPDYPASLEEDAYSFGGWYTSPECLAGTEYAPGTQMPDSHMALYAKWEPNVYEVRLFASYDDMCAFEAGDASVQPVQTSRVTHGAVLGSVENPTNGSYEFSGWFYMKNGQKTAYTPLDIPIKSDMNIYAEWNSNSAQPYTIHYALAEKETEADWLAALAATVGAAPLNNKAYTVSVGTEGRAYVYLAEDGGYHREIGKPSFGYAYQGNMRTFLPKTGAPFNQLYAEFNEGYYPTASGHSLSIAYEEDKENPVHNRFTFTYVHLDTVDYRVEYRYKDTNALIPGAGESETGVVERSTSAGVVTERFAPVTDYISDAFYKKLILAVQWDADAGKYVGAADNVVVFYYTKNSESTYYAIHYMLENLAGDDYTESANPTEGIARINETISIHPQLYSGYEVKEARLNGALLAADAAGSYSFPVEKSGSELYVYYTRKTQSYRVYYVKDGTDISDSQALENNKVAEPTAGSGKYGETVSVLPPEVEGYTCTTAGAKTLTLYDDDGKDEGSRHNRIVFFYTPLSYTVQYRAWSLGGGGFDTTSETTTTGSFNGSLPRPEEGYAFVGWFYDESCTQPVGEEHSVDGESGKLTPRVESLHPQPGQNIFYAKFLPTFGSLTIRRENAADAGMGTQSFLYRITSRSNPGLTLVVPVTGNGSVTVKELPSGEYIVEQENRWAWRYEDDAQTVTVKGDAETTVSFGDAAKSKKWLNGNSRPVQNRKG